MENKKVVDYYQHFIPQARSIVPHNNLIKTIIINSDNRDKTKYSNKFDFTLYLEDTFVDVINIEIIKAYFNYNLPIINNSNNSFSIFLNLDDQEIDDCDTSIEFEDIKIGSMEAYDTDRIIELFDECIEGSLLPKFIQQITKYSYILYYNELQNTTTADPDFISEMSLPKLFLGYNEKINRFYYYKLNTSYFVNNRYLECINPYANLLDNYNITSKSFGLFGIDTRSSYNDQIHNPKNLFSKMLGFTTNYNYECNKFQFNNLDIDVVYSEYIGTSAEYQGFRFITKYDDEFILKYEDGSPRLFLTYTALSAKNSSTLPIEYDTSTNQFVDNSGLLPPSFLLNTIADQVYHSTAMEYVTYHVNPYLNNPVIPPGGLVLYNGLPVVPNVVLTNGAPAGATTQLVNFGIIDPNCIKIQLPLEIKFSVDDTTNSSLSQLLNFTVDSTAVPVNSQILASSFAAISLRVCEVRDAYIALNIPEMNFPQGVADSFLSSGDGIGIYPAPYPTETLFPNTIQTTIDGKFTNNLPWNNGNQSSICLHSDNALSSINITPVASALVNLIKIKHPEYYQIGRFTINKTSNELLYNQLKDALCINNPNLGIMIEYVSNTNTLDINNIIIKLSNKNQSIEKTILVNLSDIDIIDAGVSMNNLYVSSLGITSPPITCSNNFSYTMSKNTNIVNYNIDDNNLTICFGYFLNDLYNRNDDYLGEINTEAVENKNVMLISESYYNYPYVTDDLLCINYTEIKDLCDSSASQDTYNSIINSINNTSNICYPKYRYCTSGIKGQSNINSSNYDDYYRYKPGGAGNFYNNIGTANSYEDIKLSEIFGSVTHYYTSNTSFPKTTTPFIGDLFYLSSEYTSAVISINFFIADSANCLTTPDYYLLDIHELNNKYSNNNEIEKHTFLEIPNNNGSLIYYESTNIGYSTKEFNPPLRKLDRLTIKIRDIYGNILEETDSSKDYTLIMNIQEINNSSNTTINN